MDNVQWAKHCRVFPSSQCAAGCNHPRWVSKPNVEARLGGTDRSIGIITTNRSNRRPNSILVFDPFLLSSFCVVFPPKLSCYNIKSLPRIIDDFLVDSGQEGRIASRVQGAHLDPSGHTRSPSVKVHSPILVNVPTDCRARNGDGLPESLSGKYRTWLVTLDLRPES